MAKAYFILPVYNEEPVIYSVIANIFSAPLPTGYEPYAIAINDGSTDGSQKELERASREYPVHIISYLPNGGIPRVFREAFTYLSSHLADSDIVFVMESDGTSDAKIIPTLAEAITQGADVAIASRHVPGGEYIRFPWHRVMGSSAINLFLRIVWFIPGVTDYTIFYRAYRGKVLKEYIPHAFPFAARRSFAVNGEILLRLSHITSSFKEVPLHYDYGLKKGKSKMRLVQTLIEYMRITPWHHLKRHAAFFKVGIVGGIGAVVQAVLLVILVERLGMYPVIANILAAEVAILSNFILNNVWSFRHHEREKVSLIKSFLLFNLSALASIVSQTISMWIGILLFGLEWYLLYAIVGIGVGWVFSYSLYILLIWKKYRT